MAPSTEAVTSRSPAVTRADSVSTGPASTATSNRWTLRYRAAIDPSGAISTDVLYGRSGSPLVSAVLPTRIQASRRRATSANGSVCGPGMGRAEAR